MNPPLAGLRIVEVSAFVAAPLGGMTLAQLGAEVIRIDPIGGNIDFNRWPIASNGNSIYWASLNKAKKSVTLALNTAEGQDLARSIMCAPGADAGIVLTNLPSKGWMGYEALSRHRADLIMIRLTGNFDGSAAVDYTVNCASGLPFITGATSEPVNHVLPIWDVAAGLYLSTAVLAAERIRAREGSGQEVTLALSDVMLATIGNLGYIGDVQINGTMREPIGNHLYGAFGRDFTTADKRKVMVVVLSDRQWKALREATGLAKRFDMIGPLMEVDLTTDGGRYHARHAIAAVLEPWFACRPLAEIKQIFEGSGVLWGVYQNFRQLVDEDPRCSTANPMFGKVDQPGIGQTLSPRAPLSFSRNCTLPPKSAPLLGQDTDSVLQDLLGLSSGDISRLRQRGILNGATIS
jgi:2-methylfumaryl-CoA isomerase